MLFPNMADWYWIVGGSGSHANEAGNTVPGDETRRYSSKRGDYVPIDDDEYQQWLADKTGVYGFDPTTRIESEASLIWVLNNANVSIGTLKA